MPDNKNKIALVMLSSDSYSDVWDYFFKYFKSNFPIDIKIYLITQYKNYLFENLTVINCDNINISAAWSDRFYDGIKYLEEQYLFVVTEDIFFMKGTRSSDFNATLDFIIENNVDYMRLAPFPPAFSQSRKVFSKINPGELHRISLQPSIWKKEFLLKILKNGENPWQFEYFGSKRSNFSENIYCANRYIVNYIEAISKGKFTRKAFFRLQSDSVGDLIRRPVNSLAEEFYRDYRHLKSRFFYSLPLNFKKFLLKYKFIGKDFK